MKNQKGISSLLGILIIVILGVFVIGGVLVYQYWWMPEKPVPTVPILTPEPIPTPDETADWEIYRNEIYKYEIKYPYKWEAKENPEGNVEFIVQRVATININFISQDTLSVMGITYCQAYPEDKNHCEEITINDAVYIIEKFSDSVGDRENILIGSPHGGALSISLISVTDELQAIFRKMLSTFRFIETKPAWDGRTGILWLYNVDCGLESGECPPDHILSPDMLNRTYLLGDFEKKHSGLIVRIRGKKTNLPYQEMADRFGGDLFWKNMGYPMKGIIVDSYIVLSKIPYHDFLVEKANEYTAEKYPCLSGRYPDRYGGGLYTFWNKTFSWEIVGSTPVLKVRMTDTHIKKSQPFYKLWYDGTQGNFIKEVKSSDIVSCPYPYTGGKFPFEE